MQKVLLFLTLPALAGVIAWNLSLSSDLDDLRSRLDGAGTTDAKAPETPREVAPAESRPRETSRAAPPEVTALVARLDAMEKRLAKPEAASADDGASAADAGGTDASAYQSDAFRGAVTKVLDDREAQRRRERMERAADGRLRFLLRDLTLTDAQRADVRRVILATLERNDQIRQDESLADEQRREQIQAVRREEVDAIAAVVDAASMDAIRQRLDGGNRLRGGGGDGAGGAGGAPSGGPGAPGQPGGGRGRRGGRGGNGGGGD